MRYNIKGENLPVVECILEPGESMVAQNGGMCWMTPNMQMQTTGGGIGKVLGRMFTGEHMFQNIYTAVGGEGLLAFASSFPGKIVDWHLTPGRDMIVQKSGFLASSSGIEMSVFFQKRLSSGVFGGEGFIMQRFSGEGILFLEFDGSIVEYELRSGQQMIVDTGYLAAMEASCSIDIQAVPGLKNMFLGGEGVFNTRVTGPGHIWLQTMPVPRLAGLLAPYIVTDNK